MPNEKAPGEPKLAGGFRVVRADYARMFSGLFSLIVIWPPSGTQPS